MQLFRRLFLTKLSRIHIWININFNENYRCITFQTFQNISHLHIFEFMFCVDLVIPESLWCHRGIAMHVTHKSMHRFLYARLKNGRIKPWQCPSVRPRFSDFFSTCFEISIWNLVYTFSRWHDMSSLSCITNLVHRWPAVYFSTLVPFFAKILFSEFWRLFWRVLDFSKFSGLFFTCFGISIWNLVHTLSRWCHKPSSSFIAIGTLWATLQLKIAQTHLSAFMALNII